MVQQVFVITASNVYDIQNSYTDTITYIFGINAWLLKIPPCLKCVATLPCEILMSAFEYKYLQGSDMFETALTISVLQIYC